MYSGSWHISHFSGLGSSPIAYQLSGVDLCVLMLCLIKKKQILFFVIRKTSHSKRQSSKGFLLPGWWRQEEKVCLQANLPCQNLRELGWEDKTLDYFLTKAAWKLLSDSAEILKFSPTQTIRINQLSTMKKCFQCPEKSTSFCRWVS